MLGVLAVILLWIGIVLFMSGALMPILDAWKSKERRIRELERKVELMEPPQGL